MLALRVGDERLAAMTMRVFNHDVSNGVPKLYTLTRLSQAEVNKLITWLSQAVMTQSGHVSITVTKR